MRMARLSAALCAALGTLLLVDGALAQSDYPSGPIRLILGSSAGGPMDTMARDLVSQLSRALRQFLSMTITAFQLFDFNVCRLD